MYLFIYMHTETHIHTYTLRYTHTCMHLVRQFSILYLPLNLSKVI